MTPQEELDFQWVIGRIRTLNGLNPPSPKASRILPPAIDELVGPQREASTSYALPRSRMMESLVMDDNARLSQDRGCFKDCKKTKGLLTAPMIRHRKYYKLEGSTDTPTTINDSMADLLKSSLDTVAKRDVVYSATEAKELESGVSSMCITASWLDHWLNAFGRATMDPARDMASIRRLLRSGSTALQFLSCQLNTTWTNVKLKRRDSVLEAMASGCSPEGLSALRNGTFDDSGNLFPEEVVREVAKDTRSRAESTVLRKAAFSSSGGKRRSSPAKGNSGNSGSGRPAKVQKASSKDDASAQSANSSKGSEKPFSGSRGRPRNKRRGKGKDNKKKGGNN